MYIGQPHATYFIDHTHTHTHTPPPTPPPRAKAGRSYTPLQCWANTQTHALRRQASHTLSHVLTGQPHTNPQPTRHTRAPGPCCGALGFPASLYPHPEILVLPLSNHRPPLPGLLFVTSPRRPSSAASVPGGMWACFLSTSPVNGAPGISAMLRPPKTSPAVGGTETALWETPLMPS